MRNYLLTLVIGAALVSVLLYNNFPSISNKGGNQNSIHLAGEDQATLVSLNKIDTLEMFGPRFSQFWESIEYLKLVKNRDNSSTSNLIFTDTNIILADFDNDNCILIYKSDGNFLTKIKLDPNIGKFVDLGFDQKLNQILVGNTNAQAIFVYNLKGELIEQRNVGFGFLKFAFSNISNRYIFYLANVIPKGKKDQFYSITLTDDKFNVLESLLPLSEKAKLFLYFTPGRFKYTSNNSNVYYNPDFTGKIYSIDFKGNSNLILDLDTNIKYASSIDSILNLPPSIDNFNALSKIAPINNNYFVNNDYIILGNVPGDFNKNLIIDRKTMNSVVVHNSVLCENFGEKFEFAYMMPQFSSDDAFLKVYSSNNYNKVMDIVNQKSVQQDLNGNLDEKYLMLFKFNPSINLFSGDNSNLDHPKINVKIFPNPVSQTLQIEMVRNYTNYEISIFSLDGVIVYSQKFSGTELNVQNINVSSFVPGPYIVRINLGNEIFSKSIIVQ